MDSFAMCTMYMDMEICLTLTTYINVLLNCRKNNDTYGTGTGQQIGKDLQFIKDSNFDGTKPTKLFLHGWLGAGWNWYIRDMRREMLKQVIYFAYSCYSRLSGFDRSARLQLSDKWWSSV